MLLFTIFLNFNDKSHKNVKIFSNKILEEEEHDIVSSLVDKLVELQSRTKMAFASNFCLYTSSSLWQTYVTRATFLPLCYQL